MLNGYFKSMVIMTWMFLFKEHNNDFNKVCHLFYTFVDLMSRRIVQVQYEPCVIRSNRAAYVHSSANRCVAVILHSLTIFL